MNSESLYDFIVPSIDILDGKIVRLENGKFNKKQIYNINIEELLDKYKCFNLLHIVNLNGAKGEYNEKNIILIKRIIQKFKGKIQLGGGIRTREDVNFWLNNGVNNVVIGTLCINNIEETKNIIKEFGKEKIVLAIDCVNKDDRFIPKINGWKEFCYKKKEDTNAKTNNKKLKYDIFYYLNEYKDTAEHFLITDICRDGMLMGTNIDLYKIIRQKFPNFKIQASGGVFDIEEVLKLKNIVNFAIIGKSIYETNILNDIKDYSNKKNEIKATENKLNKLELKRILNNINWEKVNGLVPVIIQDVNTFEVLMLGYCDKKALELTFETGKMHFFSRTKQRIWMKGEQSGNILNIIKLCLDCDNDTILAFVKPTGNTCHNGTKTCFNERVNFLSELEDIISNRIDKKDIENSYVAKLFNKGLNKIAQKVGEEATETIISALNESDERFLEESADLIFHFLLLLKIKNFNFSDIIRILKKRNKLMIDSKSNTTN